MQNVLKHILELADEESDVSPKEEVEDNNKEPSILSDVSVSVCMSMKQHLKKHLTK
jgi:hypothetical protein